jgi:hypothetical protein
MDDMWTYVDEDPGVADLNISVSTPDFKAFLTSFPEQRQPEFQRLTLDGSKLNQKLFVRLTDQFPFGLD